MHKLFKTLIVALLLTFPLSLNVKAEDIMEINNLVENAKELDRQEVTVQGEAIGERMDRGDFSWVNINDGTNAIGIWLNKSEAIKILNYGNYKYKGDMVKITGIFYRACREHGGEADLHAGSIKILEEGHPVKEHISSVKIITAVILSSFALLFLIYFFKQLILKSK
ncbi:MAG: hypothetical protein ABFD25_22945 [Clostridiaceae bacterium]